MYGMGSGACKRRRKYEFLCSEVHTKVHVYAWSGEQAGKPKNTGRITKTHIGKDTMGCIYFWSTILLGGSKRVYMEWTEQQGSLRHTATHPSQPRVEAGVAGTCRMCSKCHPRRTNTHSKALPVPTRPDEDLAGCLLTNKRVCHRQNLLIS